MIEVPCDLGQSEGTGAAQWVGGSILTDTKLRINWFVYSLRERVGFQSRDILAIAAAATNKSVWERGSP